MRQPVAAVAALVLAIVAGFVAPATPVAPVAQAADYVSDAKVVIIVGATHGTTSRYREYANDAYDEARKYTPNVVKVYSPNATWSAVKNAAKGASIVIYFGHGNGWPSPYTYDPQYRTKDGFGLNASAGNGDYNNVYYGEPYVASLDLAPNAIVMLHHLCYAAGNSEPGHAAPSLSVAKQRADNYAAGFLKSNAQAVIADGHHGPASYLRDIFTTTQTIKELWEDGASANGNAFSFASSRTSGATVHMDPDSPTSGFYRALTGDPGLTTREIIGGFTVPGRAAPKVDGAPIYDEIPALDTAAVVEPAAVLPANTRLTVLETVAGFGDDAIFRVEGLDDPSISGYAIARDLDPRDSLPPSVTSTVGAGGYRKPAADGQHTVKVRLSETSSWTLRILRGDTEVAKRSGTGGEASVAFTPASSGGDGTYRWRVSATDDWENGPATDTGTFEIDSIGPTGSAAIDSGAATSVISDVRVGLDAADVGSGVAKVRLSNAATVDGDGVLTKGETFDLADSLVWSLPVGRGQRTVYVQWQDKAGNWSEVTTDKITVDPPDTTYHAITPVRLLDTRSSSPIGRLSVNTVATFGVAGRGGIPDDAIAVTGNLTVTGQTAKGYVTLGPVLDSTPTTSTINVPLGDTRANGVVVPLDRSGRLQLVYKALGGSRTHVVFDATGYFVAGDGGARYVGVQPSRFLDTRAGSGALANAAPRAIDVGGRTVGGVTVPADAVAITGNLTVTGQTSAGYLSLTPTPQSSPSTSSLNFPIGDTRANNVTVPLGTGGNVWVVYRGTGTAHAILDVTGYYREGADGLHFVPLAPSRVLDSRLDLGKVGAFSTSQPGSVAVVSVGGLADDAKALTGNLTVTRQTRPGYASMTPAPTANPTTSTINFPLGDDRANGVATRIDPSTGKISLVYKASGSASVHLLLDVTGYFH